jgi:hypothetical protein
MAALSHISTIQLEVDRSGKEGGADSLRLAHVPAWCDRTTVGVDIQAGGDKAPARAYWAAISYGDGRSVITGHGIVVFAPAGRQASIAEIHAGLDRLDQTLADWNPHAPIVGRACDVGNQTDELLRWLRPRARTWLPVKGTGPMKPQGVDLSGWRYLRQQDSGWVLGLVETTAVTEVVHGELLSGTMLLPAGLDATSALIMHICATVQYEPGKWSMKPMDRKHHPEWQTRHDYLDCLAYARAIGYAYDHKPRAASGAGPRYGKIKTI